MIPVLHLRQGSALYGADRAVLALAEATGAPYEPVIGALARPADPFALAAEAERRGLRAMRFPTARRLDLACARDVAAFARASGVRLIHAHDFKSLFVALAAGLRARVPVVATFHGDTGSTLAVRAYELLARVLANFTRGVAAASRALERKLRPWVRAAPVAFVPNGLPRREPVTAEERGEARRALGVADDAFCVAVVGRLSIEKGHAILFEALRPTKEKELTKEKLLTKEKVLTKEKLLTKEKQRTNRKLVVLVAGDGSLRDELEAKAQGLDVRFLGFLADPRPVFAAADVIALPSLTEGLPLVALEALALGCCVVASAVGELPQVLGNGAGLLVPPGDARALSEALAKVQTAEVCAALREEALRRAADYGVAAMAGAYASLYVRALAPRPSTSR